MIWAKSPLGHITRYEYDDYGNLLRELSSAGPVVAFSYLDETGLVSTFTDASGYVWSYDYDEDEHLCGFSDHRRRLLSATDAEGRTQQLRYDMQDRVVQWQRSDGARFGLGYRRESWKLQEQLIRPDEREGRRRYD